MRYRRKLQLLIEIESIFKPINLMAISLRMIDKFFLLTCLFISIYVNVKGQTCNCRINLDSLIVNVERNYSGFEDKTAGNKWNNYAELKVVLHSKAENANYFDCYQLLREYTSFFRDPHLNLILGTVPSGNQYIDTLRETFGSFPRRKIAIDDLQAYYSKGRHDNIEGIWKALDYNFTLAIVQENERFLGITVKADSVKWFPGQIKMEINKFGSEYRILYYKGDHLPDTLTAAINGNQIDLGIYGRWERIYPVGVKPNIVKEPVIKFDKVSPSLCILTIKSSWITYKSQIDSILATNREIIRQTPYLIIDLRDNLGGHAMTLEPILPIIYTKPIFRDGLYVRSSVDNISLYREALGDTNLSGKDHVNFSRMINLMEQNVGGTVKVGKGDTLTYDTIYRYPERIGLIVNNKTTSAAELFLLWAKQSGKVTVFGSRTRGALDYTEIGRARSLPCPYLQFYCPMGKSEHKVYPYIDNIGILPDVVVPDSKLTPAYFLGYFKNHRSVN